MKGPFTTPEQLRTDYEAGMSQYAIARKYGTSQKTVMRTMKLFGIAARDYTRQPVEKRFWAKVRKTDGCWEWTRGCSEFGYGVLNVGGRAGGNVNAHRISWMLTNGTIPAGMSVLHHCDNPKCVRPEHLFLGTQADNIQDMHLKNRGRAKLNTNAVIAIREIGDSATYREIGAKFGVSRSTVQRLLTGESWRYIQTKS